MSAIDPKRTSVVIQNRADAANSSDCSTLTWIKLASAAGELSYVGAL